MVVALITLWKRPRLASASLVFALTIVLVFSNATFSEWLGRSLEWQHLPPTPVPNADAIVVLGGATRPPHAPRPWIDVMESGDRPLHGARLYLEGKASKVIMSGGRIDWKDGGPPESSDMAELAKTLGVPADAILEDPTSLNTYQNAVNVKQILEAENLQTVLLVTSAIHMPRSLQIFKKQGIEAIAAPTDFRVVTHPNPIDRSVQAQILNTVPDVGRLEYSTRALKEYIGIIIYRLKGWL